MDTEASTIHAAVTGACHGRLRAPGPLELPRLQRDHRPRGAGLGVAPLPGLALRDRESGRRSPPSTRRSTGAC